MRKYLPLNGTKTHPLSDVARETLAKIRIAPMPAQEINPGVVNRLMREGCVELVNLPSPYKKGGTVTHLRMKEANNDTAR